MRDSIRMVIKTMLTGGRPTGREVMMYKVYRIENGCRIMIGEYDNLIDASNALDEVKREIDGDTWFELKKESDRGE